MNKRRLLKLAALLEKDAANKKGIKFDLSDWATPSGEENLYFDKKNKTVPVSCKTTACAVGLACISGAFAKEGLTFGYVKSYILGMGVYILVPKFNRKKNYKAVDEFFDLSTDETVYLFQEDSYPKSKTRGASGERYVARRIRKFVEDGGIK